MPEASQSQVFVITVTKMPVFSNHGLGVGLTPVSIIKSKI